MKKRIAMIGYFGRGNFGDELFVSTHQQMLGDSYDLFVANDLNKAPYFSFPVSDLMNRADGFLIGGGDLVNPIQISTQYWKMEYLEKPVFVHGVGVEGRSFARADVIRHYRAFMRHPNCKLIVTRDVESQAWIREHINPGDDKLHCYPDPVCALRRPPATPPKQKTLGVVTREHRSLTFGMDPVRDLITTAKKRGYRVRHLVLANKDLGQADLNRARMIATEGDEIFYSDSLEEMCQAISACSILASIKLHGMIMATMYGVACIAMTDSPKNRSFLRMIDRMDLQASYDDPRLKDHLPQYPAPIHRLVRNSLACRAVAGYDLLKLAMADAL